MKEKGHNRKRVESYVNVAGRCFNSYGREKVACELVQMFVNSFVNLNLKLDVQKLQYDFYPGRDELLVYAAVVERKMI